MTAIRDAIKGAAPMLQGASVGGLGAGVLGAGLALYNGKDTRQSLDVGAKAALGGVAGMAAGAVAGYAGAAPKLAKAGMTGGLANMQRMFNRSSGLLKPSMTKMVAGGLIGAAAGAGYAVLKSNKVPPQDLSARLQFETDRKRMTVEENLRQMREMREIMNDTRMR